MNIVPAEVEGARARISGHSACARRSSDALPAARRSRSACALIRQCCAAAHPGLLSADIERTRAISAASRFARSRIAMPNSPPRVPPRILDSRYRRLVFDPCMCTFYADSRLVEGRHNWRQDDHKKLVPVLPVFSVVAFSAILPLCDGGELFDAGHFATTSSSGTVSAGSGTARSLDDLGGRFWIRSPKLFVSAVILAIEVPLGSGRAVDVRATAGRWLPCLVILALPLLIPCNVVGLSGRFWPARHRPLGYTLNSLGINYTTSPTSSTPGPPLVMDVWALDQPWRYWLPCTDVDPGFVLSVRPDRRCLALGGVPRDPSCRR